MSEDSVRKRFAVTVIARLVGLVASATTAGIVPRSLGPENYGSFQFLQTSFTALRDLLDVSVGSAFFTLSSKDAKTGTVNLLYLLWNLFHLVALALIITVAVAGAWNVTLWPHQPVPLLFAMAGLVLVTRYFTTLQSFADSKSLTTAGQLTGLASLLLLTGTLLVLFVCHRLTLGSYIAANAAAALAGLVVLGAWLYQGRARFWQHDFSRAKVREVVGYTYRYVSPLVVYGIAGTLLNYATRWLLQAAGGDQQQGYYSLALNWSQMLLLVTSAINPIYWRECARAAGAGSTEEVRRLFTKTLLVCFAGTTYFAAYIAVQGEFLVTSVAGKDFHGAALPFMLMVFYPVTQTVGQLATYTYMARGETRAYRNIGIAVMVLSVVATYFLIAPHTFAVPGLGLGALGMTLQMVGIGALSVEILLIHLCRQLGIPVARMLGIQASLVGGLLALAWGISRGLGALLPLLLGTSIWTSWLTFLLAGLGYTAVVALLLWWHPHLAGLSRADLQSYLAAARQRLRRRAN